jgi:molybdenum cofactor guanylyltransferase
LNNTTEPVLCRVSSWGIPNSCHARSLESQEKSIFSIQREIPIVTSHRSSKEMSLTAVLFAGGESRRMGTDKATLMIHGELLWKRQLDLLRLLQPNTMLLSARFRPAWCPPEVEVVPDEPPSQGPLSGLVAALARSRTTHLLTLAIDLPEMTAEHLQRLWQLALPDISVIPQRERRYEPLAAIYAGNTQSTATQLLASGRLSLQSLAEELVQTKAARVYRVSESECLLYRNVNSPADLL